MKLDGGMGTLLQKRGLKAGESPEDWNLDHPEAVAEIHAAYASAGSEVVYANTFGANAIKYHGHHSPKEVIEAGVQLAKSSGAKVALDIGPTGKMLKPLGDLDFDAAVEAFAEEAKIGAKAGADLVVIETMSDIGELKAAVVGVREACKLPIYATVALGEDGKLLTGGSVECVATLLESLNVEAYGFNCGMGPERMIEYVAELAKLSTKPIIAKPNAGLPKIVDGKTVFTVGPDEFADGIKNLQLAGAEIVGGCCGTTPDHIRAINAIKPRQLSRTAVGTYVSSATETVELRPHAGIIIGERINPTGKKLLKEAYQKGDTAYVLREAVKQVDAGAAILDVNCGVPGIDETSLLDATVQSVQGVVGCPIEIDTASPQALALALRHVRGKALVNSVNGKRESLDAVLPLVKKYGGAVVALCLDERGIPPTSEGRLEIARRILAEGEKYGLKKKDFVFDALTLSVSAEPLAAVVTLETVKRLTDELGVNTILGVSNVSFGLPNRAVLNNAMYTLAKRAGLSAAIANPSLIGESEDEAAFDVLLGRDKNCAKWIAHGEQKKDVDPSTPSAFGLRFAIEKGLKNDASAAALAAIDSGKTALAIIEEEIVPALESVGRGFESGTIYLPQLLMSADAAGEAFGVVRARLGETKGEGRRRLKVIMATVKGDIHDIGKNIVRALLENYGFEVIDLGRDVEPTAIVEAARKSQVSLVGLSALMTTTVGAMAETINALKTAGIVCRTMVGGAVVTQEYADSIGADYYAKDAMRAVRICEELEGKVV